MSDDSHVAEIRCEAKPLENITRHLNEFHQGDFHAGESVDHVVIRLLRENAALRAKLSTMVCGTCKGEKRVVNTISDSRGFRGGLIPCLTCQPKGGDDDKA